MIFNLEQNLKLQLLHTSVIKSLYRKTILVNLSYIPKKLSLNFKCVYSMLVHSDDILNDIGFLSPTPSPERSVCTVP